MNIKYFLFPFQWVFDFFKSMTMWLGQVFGQNTASYCDLQTADGSTTLVANDGSLISIVRIFGITNLIGTDEFLRLQGLLGQTFQTIMSQPGRKMQFLFSCDRISVQDHIQRIFQSASDTAERLNLKMEDFFQERERYLSNYCAYEELYLVLRTCPLALNTEQLKRANAEKQKLIKKLKIPSFRLSQNVLAALTDLREAHDALVHAVENDFNQMGFLNQVLEVHDAVHAIRYCADPGFTDRLWKPSLPGDPITIKSPEGPIEDVSDILWPALARQVLPRDAENLSLRTVRVGDRIYGMVFIDLFPKEIQPFSRFFLRVSPTRIPWRISFFIESDALNHVGLRKTMASILSVTSSQNRLIHDSLTLLEYVKLNTDDAVVGLRVMATTWAAVGEEHILRSRVATLARALESWGSCDVSEFSGDPFSGWASTVVALSQKNQATRSIAPLSDVLYMLPLFRPASPWNRGAVLFRSPDGRLWPYDPGSFQQTTWIDLFYARPGSGKSVLSNAINLAVCLSAGIQRLPRIAIIDIGPSSSGLILLLKDALPADQKHLVAYHRLRMRPEFSINPFDTQLGCRYPTPQERSFLVNFIALLATPVGMYTPYDGIADMSGLIIDELYGHYADEGNPNHYAQGVEFIVDGALEEISFVRDSATTWWEVTDALFMAGFYHEALLAQRYATPTLSDIPSICRLPAIQDLYGKIIAPTGEPLVHAVARMISSAIREYSILSQVTRFDLGEARIVSLDLDEVARSGGDAANRQTAVMYMLARYVLARHYFLTEENISDMPEAYQRYHRARIMEIREDAKRIVFDEFHRTSKAQAVRDQVIQDMREGRKWKVQVALLSQSLEDFDSVMVEFATSVFIMDAGPEQSVQKTTQIFGLNSTAEWNLKNRVHGPREEGATFLGQFATKYGKNTQLLTLTLGPIELWALNTNSEDVFIRNHLYQKLGPKQARYILAKRYPSGSALRSIEERYSNFKDNNRNDIDAKVSVLRELIDEILKEYYSNIH